MSKLKTLYKYLIVKYGGKVITKKSITNILKKFGAKENALYYATKKGYIIRIIRGYYYVKKLEELVKGTAPDIYKLLSIALNKMNVNWYFGLYTALKLNKLTHEVFTVIYVITDSIFRPFPVKISKHDVKFIKFVRKLFGFGIVRAYDIVFSDKEKTALDFVYWLTYNNKDVDYIKAFLKQYFRKINKKKIANYANNYPKTVQKVVLTCL